MASIAPMLPAMADTAPNTGNSRFHQLGVSGTTQRKHGDSPGLTLNTVPVMGARQSLRQPITSYQRIWGSFGSILYKGHTVTTSSGNSLHIA